MLWWWMRKNLLEFSIVALLEVRFPQSSKEAKSCNVKCLVKTSTSITGWYGMIWYHYDRLMMVG